MTSAGEPPLDLELHRQLLNLCRRRADQLLSSAGGEPGRTGDYGLYGNVHKSALEMLRAHTEIIADLTKGIDSLIYQAVRARANFGEIGAACSISRQAARQRYQRLEAQRKQRIEEFERKRQVDGDDVYWEMYPEEEEWPPSPWRTRAPLGYRTVRLCGGPADGQEFRIEKGADSFPRALFISHHEEQ